jgi:hypothetical protein
MRPEPSKIENPIALIAPAAAAARPRLRLGIGARLALGLAVVAAVMAIGHGLATKTTWQAVQSLRAMQDEHEPRARRAAAVVAALAAYDRSVIEYLHGDRRAESQPIIGSADELDRSVNHFFNDAAAPAITAPDVQLRIEIAHHIAQGEKLASLAAKRAAWLERRRALLDALQRRVAAAGGKGLAIADEQVVLRRSLAELGSALNAVRSSADDLAAGAPADQEFSAVRARHPAEL